MKNNTYTDFYLNKQLNIDKKLIKFRYQSEKKFFKGTSCLEMGPADGIMTEELVNDFRTIHIVDGDKELLDTIKDYSNLTKFHSWFENFEPPQKYDTIIMEHILEHVSDPESILKKVKPWLSDDGVLIAGVPNAKSMHRLAAVKMGLLKTEYELNPRDFSQGHQRVYDIIAFQKEFTSLGFKIVHKGGIFMKFLANSQIEAVFDESMINAFYELSFDFPENTADIFIVATK